MPATHRHRVASLTAHDAECSGDGALTHVEQSHGEAEGGEGGADWGCGVKGSGKATAEAEARAKGPGSPMASAGGEESCDESGVESDGESGGARDCGRDCGSGAAASVWESASASIWRSACSVGMTQSSICTASAQRGARRGARRSVRRGGRGDRERDVRDSERDEAALPGEWGDRSVVIIIRSDRCAGVRLARPRRALRAALRKQAAEAEEAEALLHANERLRLSLLRLSTLALLVSDVSEP
eukprot:5313455-Pleurochrysis_carterae.AAC.1